VVIVRSHMKTKKQITLERITSNTKELQ